MLVRGGEPLNNFVSNLIGLGFQISRTRDTGWKDSIFVEINGEVTILYIYCKQVTS